MIRSIGDLGNTISTTFERQTGTVGTTNSSTDFQAILSGLDNTKRTAEQTDGSVAMKLGKPEIDEADEAAAIKELLALMKMLAGGKIDYSVLKNSDTNKDMADGPVRSQLEKLKTVLRKLINPADNSGDPNDQYNNMSLKDLFDSLPDGTKALLKRVFPDLDELLKKEESKADSSLNQQLTNAISPAFDAMMLQAETI